MLLLPCPFLMQLGQPCSRTWPVRKGGNDNLFGLSAIGFCRQGILWYWTQTHGAFEVPLLFPGMPGRDKALGPSTALPRALPFEGDLRLLLSQTPMARMLPTVSLDLPVPQSCSWHLTSVSIHYCAESGQDPPPPLSRIKGHTWNHTG